MEPNIAEILRTTAKNISELFHMLANKVESLEQENAELKRQIKSSDDNS